MRLVQSAVVVCLVAMAFAWMPVRKLDAQSCGASAVKVYHTGDQGEEQVSLCEVSAFGPPGKLRVGQSINYYTCVCDIKAYADDAMTEEVELANPYAPNYYSYYFKPESVLDEVITYGGSGSSSINSGCWCSGYYAPRAERYVDVDIVGHKPIKKVAIMSFYGNGPWLEGARVYINDMVNPVATVPDKISYQLFDLGNPVPGREKLPFDTSFVSAQGVVEPAAQIVDGQASTCGQTRSSTEDPFWMGSHGNTGAIRRLVVEANSPGTATNNAVVEVDGIPVGTLDFTGSTTNIFDISEGTTDEACTLEMEYPPQPILRQPVTLTCPEEAKVAITNPYTECVVSDPIGQAGVTATGISGTSITGQVEVESPDVSTMTNLGAYQVDLSVTSYGETDTCSFELELEDSAAPLISCVRTKTVTLQDDCTVNTDAILNDVEGGGMIVSYSDTCSEIPEVIQGRAGSEIRLEHDHLLQLCEIELFADEGMTNPITMENAQGPSNYPRVTPSNLIDGNFDQMWFNSYSCWHPRTHYPGSEQWWTATISDTFTPIRAIRITSRKDCCRERIFGTRVYIDGALVYTVPSVIQDQYVALVETSNPGFKVHPQLTYPGSIRAPGTYEFAFLVSDAEGNEAQCQAELIAEDKTGPVIDGCENLDPFYPISIMSGCSAEIDPDALAAAVGLSASDSCTGAVTSWTLEEGTITVTDQQETTATLLATDENGNSSPCAVIIKGVDMIPPKIDCTKVSSTPISMNAECTFDLLESLNNDLNGQVISDDNCESSITWVAVDGDGNDDSDLNLGANQFTFTATDAAGNEASCSVTLTGIDTTAPTLECPTYEDQELDENCQAVLVPSFVSDDNCDESVTITPSISPLTIGLGPNIFGPYTPIDDTPNTGSSCSISVVGVDVTAPEITRCPPSTQAKPVRVNLPLNAECSEMIDLVTVWDLGLSDNCGAQWINTTALVTRGSVSKISLHAEDSSKNAAACDVWVEGVDTTNPQLSCSNFDIDVTGCSADISGVYGKYITATDDCDTDVTITADLSYEMDGLGERIFTFTATDDDGNTDSCTVTVNVEDNTNPSIECPLEVDDVQVNDNCQYVLPDTFTASSSDNCDEDVDILGPADSSENAISLVGLGTSSVYFYANDDSNNKVSCEVKVRTVDKTPPMIENCPQGLQLITIESGTCPESINVWKHFDMSAKDNCPGSLTWTNYEYPLGLDPTDVEVMVTDAHDQVAYCRFQIQGVDKTAPVFASCPQVRTISLSKDCDKDMRGLIEDKFNLVATDGCGEPVIELTAGPTTLQEGPNQYTFTATDSSDNSIDCSFTVIGHDTTEPDITCPSEQTVSANFECRHPNSFKATASDTCGDDVETMLVGDNSPLILGPNTLVFSASDGSEHSEDVSCSVVITVDDDTAPTISNCPGQDGPEYYELVDACSKEIDILKVYENIGAEDNCPGEIKFTGNIVTVVDRETTHVKLNATDANGNVKTCAFDLIGKDVSKPVIHCPSSEEIQYELDPTQCSKDISADVTKNFGITASDNCGATISKMAGPSTIGEGLNSFTFRATDSRGLTDDCTFTVVGTDVTEPVVTCPTITKELHVNGECTYENTFTASAKDQCDGTNLDVLNHGNSFLELGTSTIVFSALDNDGNNGTCSLTVTTLDRTKPKLHGCYPQGASTPWLIPLPKNNCEIKDFDITTVPGKMIYADDNCDRSPSITGNLVSVSLSETLVTLDATDNDSNRESCSFIIRGEDVTPPEITCPERPIQYEVGDQPTCTLDISEDVESMFSNAVTVDEACPHTVTKPGSLINLGGNNLVFSVNDGVFSDQCTVVISGIDTTPPTITCPAPTTINLDENCQAPNTFMATATDACGEPRVVKMAGDAQIETFNTPRTYNLKFKAIDTSNVESECPVDITVNDVHGPNIHDCPLETDILEIELPDSACQTPVDFVSKLGLTGDDACRGSVTWENRTQVVKGTKVKEYTVYAKDNKGNKSPCRFKVRGVDTKKPQIFCPKAIQYVAHSPVSCESPFPVANWIADPELVYVVDNCDDYTIVKTEPKNELVRGYGEETQVQVTLQVDDGSGNVDFCSFWVEGQDVHPPVTSRCPLETTLPLDPETCQLAIDYTSPDRYTDGCTDVTVTQSIDTIVYGANTVKLTAVDENGLANRGCSFTLYGRDVTPPSITCPKDETITVDAACNKGLPDYTKKATVSDTCNRPGLSVVQTDNNNGQLDVGGSIEVTLTATDADDNVASCTFNVAALDGTAPSIQCPSDMVVKVNSECAYSVENFLGDVDASDSCDKQLDVVQSPPPGTLVSSLEPTVITMTATDDAGQSTSCTFTLTKDDETAPVFSSCPTISQPIGVDGNCQASIELVGLAQASDACGGSISITQSGSSTIYGLGDHTIELVAEDERGNQKTCTVDVNVADLTPISSLTCPTFKKLTLDDNCETSITGPMYANYLSEASASDNCDVSFSYPEDIERPSMIGLEQTIITIRAIDAGGNSKDCTFNIMGEDTTGPVMTCPSDQAIDIDTISAESCSITKDFVGLGEYSDSCNRDLDSVTQDVESFGYGLTVVTITAVDESGNPSTCSFGVTGNDVTAPTFDSCPADGAITFKLDPECTKDLSEYGYYRPQVSASDLCNEAPTVTRTSGSGLAVLGDNTITYMAQDEAGLSASCSFVVVGKDVTKPDITCPDAETVTLNESCEYEHSFSATASDSCDGELVPVQSAGLTTFTTVGDHTLTFKAVDAAGNSKTCSVVMKAIDETGPVITGCPESDIVVVLPPDECSTEIDIDELVPDLDATDACAGDVKWSTSVHLVELGNNAIDMVATDASGVTSTCPITIVVKDETDPDILCPRDQVINHGPESCSSVIPIDDIIPLAVVTENCDDYVVTKKTGAVSVSKGDEQIELEVTDSSGNTDTCTFWAIPKDVTPPSITCPEDTSLELTQNCSRDVTNMFIGDTSSFDACGTVTITQDVNTIGFGANSITMTATDESGLTNTCTFVVTGTDKTKPDITCPDNDVVAVDGACAKAVPAYNPKESGDSCGGEVEIIQGGATEIVVGGSIDVTLTAKDPSGNSRMCTFQVSADYNVSPSISCPSNMAVTVDEGCMYELGDFTGKAIAKDACDNDLPIVQSPPHGEILEGLENTVVTMTTTDVSGMTSTCSFTITKKDETGPKFDCPSDDTVELNGETCTASFDYTGSVEGSDACGGQVTFSHDVVEIDHVGSVTVTLVGEDARGQTTSCMFSVEGIDKVAPVVECPGNQNAVLDSSCNANTLGEVSKFDACGSVTIERSSETISGTDSVEITLTATDESGLTSSCAYTLTGVDETKPTISCVDETYDLDENCQLEVDFATRPTLTGFADTCPGDVSVVASVLGGAVGVGEGGAGSLIGLGANNVELTATDAAGNTKVCSLVATGVDVTPPVITCPDDFDFDLDAECLVAEVDFTDRVEASDTCGGVQISQDVTELGLGANKITMTATDGAGLTDECSFVVTGVDVTSPEITCPGNQALACGESIPDYTGLVLKSDSCEAFGGEVSIEQSNVESIPDLLYNVTFTVTDSAGKTASCSIEVSIAPCAVDCIPEPEFGEWSPCTKLCGTGTRTRSRGYVKQGVNGGTLCGTNEGQILLEEEEECNVEPCSCTARVIAGVDYTFKNEGRPGAQLRYSLAQFHAAADYLRYTLHPDLVHMGVQRILESTTESIVDLDSSIAEDPALVDLILTVLRSDDAVESKDSDFVGFFTKAIAQLNENGVEGQDLFLLWFTDGRASTTNRKKLKALYEEMDEALASSTLPINIICYRPNTWTKFDKLTERYCSILWTHQEGEQENKNRDVIGFEMANSICPTRRAEDGSNTEIADGIENPCASIASKSDCKKKRAKSDGSEPEPGSKGFAFCSWNKKTRTCSVKPKYAALFEDDQQQQQQDTEDQGQNNTSDDEPNADDPCFLLTKKGKCVKKKVKVNGKKEKVCAWDGEFCNLKPEFSGYF